MTRFNQNAAAGEDPDFSRGRSAYDRYYGDPTIKPNPNLRPLVKGPFYAVKMVLSDLGTCGGLKTDELARVLREDGGAIVGLYAIGNTAANAFGTTYPGAGAGDRVGTGVRLCRGQGCGWRSGSPPSTLVGFALGLDLPFRLAPVTRRGTRFAVSPVGGRLQDGVGLVDVLDRFQGELTLGSVILCGPT
jgi:hypothetical protein